MCIVLTRVQCFLCYFERPKRASNFSDGLSNYCINSLSPFQSRESPKSCRDLQSYKSPGTRARELSKSSTDSESLVVKIKKKVFRFRWGISGGDVKKKACFGNVGHLRPALDPNSLTHSFDSKFC